MGRFRRSRVGMGRTLPFCCRLTQDRVLASGFSIVYNPHGPHREKRDENVRDSLVTFPSRLVPK